MKWLILLAVLLAIVFVLGMRIGAGKQGGSVAFGVVIGGTLGLVLYHHIGWTGMLVTIAAISLLPLIAAAMMREDDPVPGIAPAPRPSIRAFLKRPEARQILWIALTYRASEGLVKAMEGSYLVDAGIPPAYALQAATTHAAELLKKSADLGSVAAGKYADIIAVQGDPLQDIAVMQKVDFVMKAGTVYRQAGHEVRP